MVLCGERSDHGESIPADGEHDDYGHICRNVGSQRRAEVRALHGILMSKQKLAASILAVLLIVWLAVIKPIVAKVAVADSDKTQMLILQRDRERALNALMSTVQYATFNQADQKVATFAAELEKKYGCKIDGQTIECLPAK